MEVQRQRRCGPWWHKGEGAFHGGMKAKAPWAERERMERHGGALGGSGQQRWV